VAKFFQLAWSPSGERIAITTKTGLYLFDANDLSRVILNETAYPLRYLAFSPDGRQLATTNGNNYQIWDGITGQLIHDQFFSSNGIPGLGYDQAGNLYIADLGATGTSIDVIRLLGQETRWLASVSYAPVPFVVISPAGDTFAVPAGGIEIWAMAYRQEPLRTLGESQEVEYIYSPDGKHIAAAGINCQIQIFDVATGQTLQTITWCEQRPKSHRGLAFSLDGKRLAANNGAGALLIWDVGTGELLQTIPVAVSQTSGLAFSPDGKRLAAIGDDNTVRLWEVQP
jgi:WD40 repeat protein